MRTVHGAVMVAFALVWMVQASRITDFMSRNGKTPDFSPGMRVFREAAISSSVLDAALRKRVVEAWRS